ncbi:GNAT family N-acetyltransferase [Candidatus Cyanaurora vandensis]|uniref:GNAT family N-acetyltransferase n=1 Tax=Candidatus Cyanaurora vandensis TaxID=2714958 RepID=UPI00257D9752|nr:GNAT family N-acetyltransferase [Candidatus Cyanaurora vandensis]
MDLTFRLAEPPDYERIIAIYNQAVPLRLSTADLVAVTLAQRASWFAERQGRYPLVVAEQTGEIYGWGALGTFYSGRAGYFECAEVSVYVALDLQGRGVGPALLRYLMDLARTHQFRRLVALVFAHNLASLKMCHRLGFERWGYLPGVANMDGMIRDVEILGYFLDTVSDSEPA